MGRTVPAFRPALDYEIKSWNDYRRGLRPEEQNYFDRMMNLARIHSDAGSLAARPLLSEVLFISILLEQQKAIDLQLKGINELKQEVNELKQEVNELKQEVNELK